MTETKPRAKAAKILASKATAKGTRLVIRDGKGRVRVIYRFGGAELKTSRRIGNVSAATLEQSREAMRELGGRLLKPGVKLAKRKGVPRFYVDETDPTLVFRDVDGIRERGRFEDGKFRSVA